MQICEEKNLSLLVIRTLRQPIIIPGFLEVIENQLVGPGYYTNVHLLHGYFHDYLNSTLFKLCVQSQEMNRFSLRSSLSYVKIEEKLLPRKLA